jgi:D-apionolactonase
MTGLRPGVDPGSALELIELQAGPLRMALDGSDLRYVSFDGTELLRRAYMAVRDLAWGTVPPVVVSREIEAQDGQFAVRTELAHKQGAINLASVIEACGREDGTIEYAMVSRAAGSFEFAKIGLNLHHPIDGLRQRPWRGRTADGTRSGMIPSDIHPQLHLRTEGWDLPMFVPVCELWLEHEVGTVHLDFAGDFYEMEDQRNWSDQSFKTYSMPAYLGYRHEVAAGEELVQRFRLTFTQRPRASKRGGGRSGGPSRREDAEVRIGPPSGGRVPPVGLLNEGPLSQPVADLLGLVRPAHVRVEVDLARENWSEGLQIGLAACRRLDANAELAVFLERDPRPALGLLAAAVQGSKVPIARVLAFRRDEDATPLGWVELVREALAVHATTGGGTHLNFAELNRVRPDVRGFDALAYPVSPQVHASDDLSLVENLEAQGEQVRSVRSFASEAHLAVGPVTLEPRWRLTSTPDPRQETVFAAAWTLGSLKFLSEAGADSVTFGEIVGCRGIVGVSQSGAARAFPVLHALADASGLTGCPLLSCSTGEEPWLCCVAVQKAATTVLLVANLCLSARTTTIAVQGCTAARARILDATTAAVAADQPRQFRAALKSLDTDAPTIRLERYGTAYVELAHR